MRLLLFEIDDVLVWTRGGSLEAILHALCAVYGVPLNTERYFSSGKTDPQIARDLLRRSGLGPEIISAGMARWAETMPQALRAVLTEFAVEACPGVHDLLDALTGPGAAERLPEEVVLGLLTGSLDTTAPIKLAAGQIDASLFHVGAYGSDDRDRKQLPAIAVMRAEEVTDRLIMREEVVIIGATPADIACAHAYGACAVAVATGRFTPNELRRYTPEHVFEDLSDLASVLHALLGDHASDAETAP